MAKRVCRSCGYIYDEKKEHIKYRDLPYDWKCPKCGAPKVKVVEQHILPKMFALFAIFIFACYLMYSYFDNQKPTEIDVYITDNEISTLYAGMIMINNNNKSYMWYQDELYDKDVLKSRKDLTLSDNTGKEISDTINEEINTFLSEATKDKKVRVHLYVSDDLNWIEYTSDIHQYSNYNVTYLNSGIASYNRDYLYSADNSYDEFKEYKKLLEDIKKSKTVVTSNIIYKDKNLLLVSAMQKNYNYIISYPSYITSSDVLVNIEYKDINFVQETIKTQYSKLDSIEQNEFLRILDIDKGALDSEFFKDAEKPYLIFTGTTPVNGNYNINEFRKIIQKYAEDYSSTYHLIYLPEELPNEAYIELFETNGIQILPKGVSLSMLEAMYPNINICGFINDEYLEVDSAKVLFTYKGLNEVSYPLNTIYSNVIK